MKGLEVSLGAERWMFSSTMKLGYLVGEGRDIVKLPYLLGVRTTETP